jgi:signal transduction histidine kinase
MGSAENSNPGADGADARRYEMLARLMEIAKMSALAELAAGIAHEINQPLGAIATYAQAAERMLAKPVPMVAQSVDVLRQIHQQSLDASANIRRIRALFDLSSSPRATCAMMDLIEDLRPVLDLMAGRVHGHIRADAPADIPPVNVSRIAIQHVLCTLVHNACEASQTARDPVIEISVSSDRYEVKTQVVDAGEGIAPQLRDRLFQPFFTTKANGTGLGLASCRAIVEAHEGSIGFEDGPGGGSRFWFRLPVAANGATSGAGRASA